MHMVVECRHAIWTCRYDGNRQQGNHNLRQSYLNHEWKCIYTRGMVDHSTKRAWLKKGAQY